MKKVTEYVPKFQPKTVEQKSDELPENIKQVLNYCFDEMKMAKKSWRAGFSSDASVKLYLIGLGKAMAKGKINTLDKLQFGLDMLYLSESDFLPSAGQFVAWCKDGYNQYLRQKQLLENTKRITDEKKMLTSDTWEQRHKAAKSALQEAREILKGGKK